MISLWLYLILALLSFVSLYVLMKKMNIVHVIGGYFLSNIILTNTGVIINLNLELTTQDPYNELVFWTQKIPELSLKPALLLWIIYLLFSGRSLLKKLIQVSILLTALVSIEVYFVSIHYLEWVNWNVFYSYLRYILIVLLMAVYVFYLEKAMHRSKEVNHI
ncbi:hypothetical protein LCM10_08125 [Rossellomorea aquimaris]|uniref:hypothetical protein n=1 Tax=Rossellomorea aquimaris TaxID=189382 RepID=UPI001CD36984|nr:hypothetical protein [Rossellomorea aquimaris]MCA1054949.1 hypothetical protein [Rossellomorea aquimaris]